MRPWLLLLAPLGIVLGLMACGEAASSGDGKAVAPVAVAPLAVPAGTPALPAELAGALAADAGMLVTWSAHARAKLEPCGCSAGMQGGLVRRAALLARVAPERRLTLEAGGWSGGAAPYQLLRARYYLQGLTRCGVAAVGVGAAEVRLGAEALAGLTASGAPPRVSANVPGFPASVTVERGGVRWLITSVAPAGCSGPGLSAGDPVAGLLAVLRAAVGARVVVLADLDEDGLERLARDVPGIALLIGGDVASPSLAPRSVGSTRIVFAANEGKTLGWWPWGAAACSFELINDTIPDHPELRAVVRDYQVAVAALDVDLDPRFTGLTALGGAAGGSYVGDAACQACHAPAATIHLASPHAHALATLAAKGYAGDPDCLRCHVTGLGLPGGYRGKLPAASMPISASAPASAPAFAGVDRVGCEACHGRGAQHVAERSAGGRSSGSLTPVTPATCQRCHDRENSPRFAFDTYWPRIRHAQ